MSQPNPFFFNPARISSRWVKYPAPSGPAAVQTPITRPALSSSGPPDIPPTGRSATSQKNATSPPDLRASFFPSTRSARQAGGSPRGQPTDTAGNGNRFGRSPGGASGSTATGPGTLTFTSATSGPSSRTTTSPPIPLRFGPGYDSRV